MIKLGATEDECADLLIRVLRERLSARLQPYRSNAQITGDDPDRVLHVVSPRAGVPRWENRRLVPVPDCPLLREPGAQLPFAATGSRGGALYGGGGPRPHAPSGPCTLGAT
jgi:hypothetical protein